MTGSVQPQKSVDIPVIDYEGSQYRADFWGGQGRQYEDAAERIAIERMLPANGGRIAEIGAGFGRLAELYEGYEQIVLFDYSRSLLQDAARERGSDGRFVFVAGNLYSLPLASGILDSLVMVRVMHHLADVPAALQQLRRTLHRHSVGVIEFANKRNLKALARWALGRQSWSPLDHEPIEFVRLNYDFHPAWMEKQMQAAGLRVKQRYAVSNFRLGAFKNRIDAAFLAGVDSWLFAPGGTFPLAPSVFLKVDAPAAGQRTLIEPGPGSVAQLLRCPICGAEPLKQYAEDRVACGECNSAFARRQGVWDLKEVI
ncbi:MAG: methyltransferase domain-containing protein [Caldilineaceae bacterium]|nr:methyltransferase domain-containing protein [Caldilineaceae bacterium]